MRPTGAAGYFAALQLVGGGVGAVAADGYAWPPSVRAKRRNTPGGLVDRLRRHRRGWGGRVARAWRRPSRQTGEKFPGLRRKKTNEPAGLLSVPPPLVVIRSCNFVFVIFAAALSANALFELIRRQTKW